MLAVFGSRYTLPNQLKPRLQQNRLKLHLRFHVHFTPTSSSWLNMVERLIRDLTQNRLRCGVFRDVEELIMAILDYIDRHQPKLQAVHLDRQRSDILETVKRQEIPE